MLYPSHVELIINGVFYHELFMYCTGVSSLFTFPSLFPFPVSWLYSSKFICKLNFSYLAMFL
jgi:hypothetical protein